MRNLCPWCVGSPCLLILYVPCSTGVARRYLSPSAQAHRCDKSVEGSPHALANTNNFLPHHASASHSPARAHNLRRRCTSHTQTTPHTPNVPSRHPPQIIAATFLSGLATSAWAWTNPFSRDATFAAVTIAVAASRAASAMLARPALGNLVGVALGHAGDSSGAGGANDGHHRQRRRLADGTLLAVAAGVSQSIGVLAMGVVFSKAVTAGADAGVVSFRLVAAAFVGVYLATLVVHSSEGTAGGGPGAGGGRGRWRGGNTGPWLPMCDCVEQAVAATTVSSPSSASYTLGRVWGGDQAEDGWVAAAGSNQAKES